MQTDALALPVSRGRALDFIALAKPRLNVLVVLTAMVGYYLGATEGVDFVILLNTIVGTAMVAGGASALNQFYERDVDRLMRRTRSRPLPCGRLQPSEARAFGVLTTVAGLLVLSSSVNLLAAGVAFATLTIYLGVYTPLKRRTPYATVIGAVPGALPPLIGWCAAGGALTLPAWVLFAIVFCWQLPHFLAIAWIYRDDYARAGLPMLPVVDLDGRRTRNSDLAVETHGRRANLSARTRKPAVSVRAPATHTPRASPAAHKLALSGSNAAVPSSTCRADPSLTCRSSGA